MAFGGIDTTGVQGEQCTRAHHCGGRQTNPVKPWLAKFLHTGSLLPCYATVKKVCRNELVWPIVTKYAASLCLGRVSLL